VTRELDPIILTPAAATASAPGAVAATPGTPAPAAATGPWEHRWTFTQGL
jgi:hypothetical protein